MMTLVADLPQRDCWDRPGEQGQVEMGWGAEAWGGKVRVMLVGDRREGKVMRNVNQRICVFVII